MIAVRRAHSYGSIAIIHCWRTAQRLTKSVSTTSTDSNGFWLGFESHPGRHIFVHFRQLVEYFSMAIFHDRQGGF
jgi:hypothetical protein